MPTTLEAHTDHSQICLAGQQDISGAATLKTRIEEAIARGLPLQISMAAVESMDVTCLQLLVAGSRACRNAALDCTFDGPFPEAISTTLREAGLDPVQLLPCVGCVMEEVK